MRLSHILFRARTTAACRKTPDDAYAGGLALRAIVAAALMALGEQAVPLIAAQRLGVLLLLGLGCKPRLESTVDKFGNVHYPGHDSVIDEVAFSHGGRYLASIDQSGLLIVRDLQNKTQWKTKVKRSISPQERMIMAFSPVGNLLAINASVVEYNVAKVIVFDAGSGKIKREINPGEFPNALLFDSEGHLLIACRPGVSEWSPVAGTKIRNFDIVGSDSPSWRMALSKEENALVFEGAYYVWMWDYQTGRLLYSVNNWKNRQSSETSYRFDGRTLVRNGYNDVDRSEFYKEIVERGIVDGRDAEGGLYRLGRLVQGHTFNGEPVDVSERKDKCGWVFWTHSPESTWTVQSMDLYKNDFLAEPIRYAFHPATNRIAFSKMVPTMVSKAPLPLYEVVVGKLVAVPKGEMP